MEERTEGKRPKALAITLVILVFSMMGNILLLTQNIGHKQGRNVEDGEALFAQFAGTVEELGYWRQAVAEPGQREDEAGARLAARYAGELTERGGEDLQLLMASAESMSNAELHGAAEASNAYLTAIRGTLADIGTRTGPLGGTERGALTAIDESLAELLAAAEQFPFYAEGDRNTMIRLANGHEWLHVADELRRIMLEFVGETSP